MPLKIKFDVDAFEKDAIAAAADMLESITSKAESWMRQNLYGFQTGTYPHKFKDPVSAALKHRIEERTNDVITAVVGLIDNADEWTTVKARILEHGTGAYGEESRGWIWHTQGKDGLNDNVTGYNNSDKPSFQLPEGFNMNPGHWFSDAVTLIDGLFDDAINQLRERIDPTKYLSITGELEVKF